MSHLPLIFRRPLVSRSHKSQADHKAERVGKSSSDSRPRPRGVGPRREWVTQPSVRTPASVLPLAGQKWVFTGGLTHLTRRDAQEKIEALGARATGSVSKSTTVVVIGEDAGSKADDAQKLGIKTMNEDELLAFLRGNGIDV